jgi:hypothetical protein
MCVLASLLFVQCPVSFLWLLMDGCRSVVGIEIRYGDHGYLMSSLNTLGGINLNPLIPNFNP